jgi:hypothetical protein
MKVGSLLAIALALTVVFAARAAPAPIRISLDHAEADARAAAARGDLRLLVICRFACYAPGAETISVDRARSYGRRMLDPSGDSYDGPADLRAKAAIDRYAKRYNAALIAASRQR